MRQKTLAACIMVAILASTVWVAPAAAAQPKLPAGLIAVDMDPYYKALKGKAAADKIQRDTRAAGSLAASGGAASGIGDVEWLYADGWREFTLRAIGGNAEIWVANDLSYPSGDPRPEPVVTQEQIDYLFSEFNDTIYPSNTTYFGYTDDRDGTGCSFGYPLCDSYLTDNSQRVMILVYNIIDESYYDPEVPFYTAGYFWPEMNDLYADRNIIHIDTHDWENRIGPDVERPYAYEQTFAHEYEHAIHYDHDPDEAAWVDEGMADLAPFLAGYGHTSDHLAYYLLYHRTPLTLWGGGLEDYGESYLFQLYLLENFGGPSFITALVDEPANGIAGIENQLAAFGYSTTFNEIYRDWTLANYLDNTALDGTSGAMLGYVALDIPSADTWGYSIQWSIANYYGSDNQGNLPLPRYWGGYKSGTVQYPIGDVMPYGPMYLTYRGYEPQLISAFRGANITGVEAHGGSYELWGGRADLLFNTATLAVPVTLNAHATLTFYAWYEIEQGWDFCFVQISTDGGSTWTSLANANTTSTYDPNAISTVKENVPGFTGSSSGWAFQAFDLTALEGETVLLRFLYVTDWATTESGFYLDDLIIADDGGVVLSDNLEGGSGNWVLDGWTRTTGLATNDWALTFLNPLYTKGRFTEYDIADGEVYLDGDYQWESTTLDTLNLNRDLVTIVLSNHLPEETSFPASYRLLVEKGSAR